MASKKGLSDAEKRTRMSEIFLSGEFYTFKEIEKIATQQKKIVVQSVKDILQSLVDDGLVSSDKIGTSIYYWSFPSDAKRTRQAKIQELNEEIQLLAERQSELKNLIGQASSYRQENDERTTLLVSLREKERLKQATESELSQYRDCDPRILEENIALLTLYQGAITRLTDNIWILHGYFTQEMGATREEVNEMCGIDDVELDKVI